jgi:regulator of sirC expression with transglutaminase-like and TPR domain
MGLMLKTNTAGLVLRMGRYFVGLAKLLGALVATFLFATNAFANVVDSIEIARLADQAQITIRFTTEIQYLRHGPEDEGKFLRIFLRVTKPGFVENEVMQETLRSPKSDLIPRFTVAYPEVVNGMLITFAKTTQYSVRPGSDNRSILIFVPLPPEQKGKGAVAAPAKMVAAAPEKPPAEAPVAAGEVAEPASQIPDVDKSAAPPPLPPEKVETLARGFLAEAREAFIAADYVKTINRLNRILGLPANSQTEPAQALIGEAREQNGEIAKARAEYELFLKLYPASAEAPRLKQRLAGLPSVDVVRRQGAKRPVRDDKPAEWQVTGSVSSYFFTGRSQTDSGPKRKDQESLVSSASVNARLRDAVTDTRFVFRDTDFRNFMQPSRNYNRVYSAYAERTDREVGYFVRAGRQNPNGAGVLERFDGITGGYTFGSDWRVNGVYGKAVEFNSPFEKDFYGASVELLPQLGRPGASLYAIEQNLDGYLNRRAIGSEFRYFDGQFSGYGTVDYDVLYKGLNIVAAQGNYLDSSGNNYFISYDYRKSPSYSLVNALGVSGYSTVSDLVNNLGMGRARTLAADSTAASKMFAAGMTMPFGERWQFGVDYRMSSIGAANALLSLDQICSRGVENRETNDPRCLGGPRGDTSVYDLCAPNSYDSATNTCQAGQNATGETHMISLQAIGTNLFVPNAVGVATAGFFFSPGSSGQNLGLNYIYPLAENWRLEGNLRYFRQSRDDGSGSTDFSPSVKLAHQWRNSLFLETEVGMNNNRSTGATSSQFRREYLYVGIRWDYR